jgi:predicted XRE-type DNA-binding protein
MSLLKKILNWFTVNDKKQRKPHTKITPEIIEDIYEYKEQNWTQSDIALVLGVSASSVSRVLSKKVKNETSKNTEK